MKLNHWNIISADLPTIYDSKRFLFLLYTNFIYGITFLRFPIFTNRSRVCPVNHLYHHCDILRQSLVLGQNIKLHSTQIMHIEMCKWLTESSTDNTHGKRPCV